MKLTYKKLKINNLTGNLREDVYTFLVDNNCPKTAEHSMKVGKEAGRIAVKANVYQQAVEFAGYLHDISAVFPNDIRIEVAHELGIEVLPEEEIFPMIIHQKISKEMSKDIFNITNNEILESVGCHTTLKHGSTEFDKVLFVADKIEWDQTGKPPYLNDVLKELDNSVEHAAFEYINYLWKQREKLKVIHPWLEEAYYELKDHLR